MSALESISKFFKSIVAPSSGPVPVAPLDATPKITPQANPVSPQSFSASPGIKPVKSRAEFHELRLDNGLRVLFKQSKGAQLSAELVFKSGSAKDPAGKEGLAHFLEHIACSNTQNFRKDLFAVTSNQGGYFNAYTGHNMTGYDLLLPKDKLDLALNILSSLMGKLEIDPTEFKKEHGIINAEIYMSEKRNKFSQIINENLYGKDHPLAKKILGTKESLEKISMEDLYKFYREQYVPNNATLVLSGDVSFEELKLGLNKYFSGFKSRPETKEVDLSQGLKPSTQKEIVVRDDTLTPCFSYVYKLPKFNHRDSLIMSLISKALSGGKDSRLQKKLVDGQAFGGKSVAQFVSAVGSTNKFFGNYSIGIGLLDQDLESNMQKVGSVLDAELKDIAANGLTPLEFSRVINNLENSEIYAGDSQHARIGAVQSYAGMEEDWSQVFFKLDDIKTITNEDIKAFVNRYLIPENRKTFKVFGKGQDFKSGFNELINKESTKVQGESLENQIIGPVKFKKLLELSGGLSRLEARLEGLQKLKHPNGMELYYKQDRDLPLSFMHINFDGGSLVLPPEKQHIIGMLQGLLSVTGTYNPHTGISLDKFQIENIFNKLGSSFSLGFSLDHGGISVDFPSKSQAQTLAVVNELLNHPGLLESQNPEILKRVTDEFNRIKIKSIDMIKMFEKFPVMQASEKFSQAIYPKDHIFYQRSPEEAIKLIESITLDDLRSYYRQFVHAKNAKITAVGDISLNDLNSQVIPLLAGWNSSAHQIPRDLKLEATAPVLPKSMNFQIIEANNNSPESTVVIGNSMNIKLDDPDHYPALIANMILGAGGESRLFKGVREEKGLCYHVGSSISPIKLASGPFSISLGCDPKNIKNCIQEVYKVVQDFLTKGPTREELELAKNDIKKSFALHSLNSRSSTAGTVSNLQYRNKDEQFVNNFSKMIDSITLEQVVSAGRKFILPKNFTMVATVPKGFNQAQIIQPVKEPAKQAPLTALAA
jgi:zinc protease